MWEKRISHSGLKAFRVIKGATSEEVELKAGLQQQIWNDRWTKIQAAEAKRKEKEAVASRTNLQREWAAEQSREAERQLQRLATILVDGIEQDHSIEWEKLKDKADFPSPRPQKPRYDPVPVPPEPISKKVVPHLTFIDIFIPPLRHRKERNADNRNRIEEDDYRRRVTDWEIQKERIQKLNHDLDNEYARELRNWESEKGHFIALQSNKNQEVDALRSRYLAKDPIALNDCWQMVLSDSDYPETFPKSFSFDYLPETKILIVDYALPNLAALPKLKELKFIGTRSEFREVHLSPASLNRLYDETLYQTVLRTLYSLFQSDEADAIGVAVFNGWVDSVDKATGQEVTACVLSVQATKAEFMAINLSQVEPKACFKKLKGISGAKLCDLSPVRPVLQLNKDDKRFVSSYAVADTLDGSKNLAAMDWLDFENLIREVFEKEFNVNGGEVKITRASRDGGVDAIAFDPDPIRGGKIVIQAKRYTNTVSVSAVRDLYGTVVNEGATKGLLVTTADYGPDAYEFAKDKPITLLSGNELLYLLQKHGHRAKIDLAEAKRLAAEADQARSVSQPT